MKIRLHNIITSLAPQGAQKMLLRVLTHIDRERFAPVVTSLTGSAPMSDEFGRLGIPVHDLGMRGSLDLPLAFCRLAQRLRADPPDIVQTWLYHADLLGGLAARMAGPAKVVWNIRHTNLAPGVNRRSTLLTAKACALFSERLPARIICCAEAARQSHVEFGYAARRIEVIPNGFDLSAFCRQRQAGQELRKALGLTGTSVLIGMVARFHPQKDHHNFIQAAGRFALNHPASRFLLAGDEICWENRKLAGWIEQAGIADRVTLFGRCEDIPRLLSAFDIATSSSLGEGFPNAVAEAMACEVPCVVTDVGDSAALIGDTGCIVPAQNPAALAAGWEEMAALGRAGRALLGERARRRIRECYSIASVVRRYENLYLGLIPGEVGDRERHPCNVSVNTSVD